MHEHSLQLLEFFRIRQSVADYALSPEGQASVLKTLPLAEAAAVRECKAQSSSIRQIFMEGHGVPPASFTPIEESVRIISKQGTALMLDELWALGMWADSYENLKQWLLKSRNTLLSVRVKESPGLTEVVAIVFKIVARDGEVRDLPELRDIRNRIQKLNMDIQRTTASFFQDEGTRAMLQNDVPTQRDGRTVLAVRAGFKARIRGIVHEVSGTGQTVFIEPEELVQKNNALVEEEARYQRELLRILREVTAKLFLHHERISAARGECAFFDAMYARGRYSQMTNGIYADDRETGIALVKAKHPILGTRAVPIDLCMPDDARTLIITGPNTGGKTVALKTAGLFALMNQFGLALPAGPGTGLPIFDGVWADIGDEQSIDQSLSTFSGHMRTISAIVNGASDRSLVLLDELGSGTDPEEGCAIAMALLDLFIARGAITLVTTHHGILKNFGYTKEGVLNASVDFDRETLSPTYRILMGIPGESRALDIAGKNGVSSEVVDGARRYLRDERTDISAMIRGLSEKHRELDAMHSEGRSRLRDAMEEQRKADLKDLQLRQKEIELKSHGIADLKNLLSDSRKTLENLVRALREGELTRDKTQGVKEFFAELDGKIEKAEAGLRADERELRPESPVRGVLGIGSPVLVLPARKRGKILRAAKNGSWVVETDALRVTVEPFNLELTAELVQKAPSISIESSLSRSNQAVLELDIRGYRLMEAIQAVERQLDAATLQNLSSFSIIHGTGEGVLQQGVRETLARYPGVTSFCYAKPEQGGNGKTLVTLGS